MTTFTTKLIAASMIAAGLAGAASSAMADETINKGNREFQAVAAGAYDQRGPVAGNQVQLPVNAEPASFERTISMAPAGSLDPHYGPFSDNDPHSGPSHNG
ncbi:hypothetical protein GCM10007301_08100 [Azorhizobium oxalatiphilum]|uniref:Uncharacterized protein n=1 Tax=Azorhizobium oxalatiphilum TaxID=980631 RepID=A0A917BPB2_9HYPH|nr:hypothetical protein [Azorhizobium oxalatiphilum]GGF51076.1 hypothetical protein GCM10007301_08100 [Azorhizobium oxalatiphilum]